MTPSLRASVGLILLAGLSSCGKDPKDTEDTAPACAGPTVSAGADLSVTLSDGVKIEATGTTCSRWQTSDPQWNWTSSANRRS